MTNKFNWSLEKKLISILKIQTVQILRYLELFIHFEVPTKTLCTTLIRLLHWHSVFKVLMNSRLNRQDMIQQPLFEIHHLQLSCLISFLCFIISAPAWYSHHLIFKHLRTQLTQANFIKAIITMWMCKVASLGIENVTDYFCSPLQELREMVSLPNTRADILPADFEGIAKALKGKNIKNKRFLHLNTTLMSIQTPEYHPLNLIGD